MRATEAVDQSTKDLDIVDSVGISQLLGQANGKIFSGCLSEKSVLASLHQLITSLHDSVKSSVAPIKILMSGAGTSGRLSFVASRAWKNVPAPAGLKFEYKYLIAGHDPALIKGQEVAEDNTVAAIQDLTDAIGADDSYSHVIYIGITCGFSAPYVASQLDWILAQNNTRITSILMGFNEVSAARASPVEGWHKTVHEVVQDLYKKTQSHPDRHFIINPIYGPEPISGSTRMKGGTVTKILLDTIFAQLYQSLGSQLIPEAETDRKDFAFADLFNIYNTVNTTSFSGDVENLGQAIEVAGQSLCSDGHVYYVGADELGVLALVDASECPPTYGAAFTDVKGFLVGGWKAMGNNGGDLEDPATSPVADQLEIFSLSETYFQKQIIPTLTKNDTILILEHGQAPHLETLSKIVAETIKQSPESQYILLAYETSTIEKQFNESHKVIKLFPNLKEKNIITNIPSFVELSAKWILNTISTGAHIKRGKVFQNIMVDLGLSNNKLYERAIKMVSSLVGTNLDDSETAVLKSLYLTEDVEEVRKNPISTHNHVAVSKRKKVVPLALLLATGQFTVQTALEALEKEPISGDRSRMGGAASRRHPHTFTQRCSFHPYFETSAVPYLPTTCKDRIQLGYCLSQNLIISFIGEKGVGKSSISVLLGTGSLPDQVFSLDDLFKSAPFHGHDIPFQLLDASGSTQFTAMEDIHHKNADVIVLLYSVTSEPSFKAVPERIQHIRRIINGDPLDQVDQKLILLVGNKIDQDCSRKVTTTQGRELAEKHQVGFMEISVTKNTNLDQLFMVAAEAALLYKSPPLKPKK